MNKQQIKKYFKQQLEIYLNVGFDIYQAQKQAKIKTLAYIEQSQLNKELNQINK